MAVLFHTTLCVFGTMNEREEYRAVWPNKAFPAISYGLPFPHAVAKHVSTNLQCSQVFVVISRLISQNIDSLQRLQDSLGDRLVDVRKGMKPHTWYSEILEIAKEVMATSAECIVTLGGGTLIDGAKAVAMVCVFSSTTVLGIKARFFKSVSDGFGKAIGNHADTHTKLNQLLHSSLEYSQEKVRSRGSLPSSPRRFPSSASPPRSSGEIFTPVAEPPTMLPIANSWSTVQHLPPRLLSSTQYLPPPRRKGSGYPPACGPLITAWESSAPSTRRRKAMPWLRKACAKSYQHCCVAKQIPRACLHAYPAS